MMSCKRRFAALCVIALVLALMLFFFSSPYVLYMLICLFALAFVDALALFVDGRRISARLSVSSGSQIGKKLHVNISADWKGRLFSTAALQAEISGHSVMFGFDDRFCVSVPLRQKIRDGSFEISPGVCGEVIFTCSGAVLIDALGLFSLRIAAPAPVRAVVYPAPVSISLSMSHDTVGSASSEGMMQNRRGSDPSEIFDLREYIPGDDIRSIHWKLSSKTDGLVVRQASDPSHYDVALLPDLGLSSSLGEVTKSELNSACSLVGSFGEQLLGLGASFCLAIPTAAGLQMHEIRSLRELNELLPVWLGTPVRAHIGDGLSWFLSEQLEQSFTRLIIVSPGKYPRNIASLGRRIGVTVVASSSDVKAQATTHLGFASEAIVLPADIKNDDLFRIVV